MSRDQSRSKKEKRTDEWLTPQELVMALGPFDLDPAAPVVRPWPTALRHFTKHENGLLQPWAGMVWLNPPYSRVLPWIDKLAKHGLGVALLPASTGSRAWQKCVFNKADGVAFLSGRTIFCRPDGVPAEWGAGYYAALVAFGDAASERVQAAIMLDKIDAKWVTL